MWLKESNSYFCKIENFAYGEINERSFSNPHLENPEGVTQAPLVNFFVNVISPVEMVYLIIFQ